MKNITFFKKLHFLSPISPNCFSLNHFKPSFNHIFLSNKFHQNHSQLNMDQYKFNSSKLNNNFSNEDNLAILVSCGSFNPVTMAHLQIFEVARDYIQKEHNFKVIGGFMSPVHDGYEKAGLISFSNRIQMCNLAVLDSDWIATDSWEGLQPDYTRTLFVLQHFQSEINSVVGRKVRVLMLCGADLLKTIEVPNVWLPDHVDSILKDFGLAVVERDDLSSASHIFASDILYKYRKNIFNIAKFVKNNLSSTQVRHLRRRGYSIRYYVPDTVLKYIEDHKLYSLED